MKNIVLIGMPGTGKSVVGRALAQRLDYTFVDVDDLIVEKTGKTLPEILRPQDLVDRGIAAPAGLTIREIYCQREPLYARYADLIVASREGEDDTARMVEEVMRTVGVAL